MAQKVKCLPHSYEDLNSFSRTYIESQAWWYVLVSPVCRTQRWVYNWGSLASQLGWTASPRYQWEILSQKQRGWLLRAWGWCLNTPTHVHTPTLPTTHPNTHKYWGNGSIYCSVSPLTTVLDYFGSKYIWFYFWLHIKRNNLLFFWASLFLLYKRSCWGLLRKSPNCAAWSQHKRTE